MPRPLTVGAAVPFFRANAVDINPNFGFDSVAGRYVVLLLAGALDHPLIQPALAVVEARRAVLDDSRACLFTISCDASATSRMRPSFPGIRHFLDVDAAASTQLGAADGPRYHPHWLLLDPQLRVVAREPIGEGHAVFDRLESMLAQPVADMPTPVLVIPRVFDADTCADLIARYEAEGGTESGFMRELDGATRMVLDPTLKRRSDVTLTDEALLARLRARMSTAIVPMIKRSFQFDATRIERFIVACYDGADGGHFRAHRDNTTRGTAHRRFACTINLNAEDYEGGDLRFPEFGDRTWRAPTGGALIFSCGLLHEATPVTRGRRYAFLPFFYDDAAAAIREENRKFISTEPARRMG